MSQYSTPNGITVSEPSDYTPSVRVVAEYAAYDRDYLLYRIEELEDTETALSKDLDDMWTRAQRAERLLQAAADVYRHGTDPIAEEIAEAVANAAAPPKRGRKRP